MSENINLITTALVFLVPVAVIVVIAFAIYKAAYKRRINKRLAEGREADIKPMISPVKFVIVTMLSVIGGLILIWVIVLSLFRANLYKQKTDMIVYPSVHYYRDNILEDSLYAGYKFGDEIKGYNRFSRQYDNVKLEIYVSKYGVDSFPSILVAFDYVGNKQNVMFSGKTEFSYQSSVCGYELCPDSLLAIDVGGYKGKLSFIHSVYYRNDIEHFLDVEPDASYELDFRIHESGSIACPQLGLTVS